MPLDPLVQALVDRKMATAQSQLKQEMPNEMAAAHFHPMDTDAAVGPYQVSGGSPIMGTNPATGDIYYNPETLSNFKQGQVGDLLAHELTHIKQGRNVVTTPPSFLDSLKSLFTKPLPYNQDPLELEGYQAQNDRAVRQHRTPMPMPNFLSDGFRTIGDVNLPAKGKK